MTNKQLPRMHALPSVCSLHLLWTRHTFSQHGLQFMPSVSAFILAIGSPCNIRQTPVVAVCYKTSNSALPTWLIQPSSIFLCAGTEQQGRPS